MLPLHGAYTLWSVFQAIQLIVISTLLRKTVLRRVSWRFLIVIFLLFVSVLLDFLHGQDSLLLLLLLTLAFAQLERHQYFPSCLMGCGLFKFHLVVPAIIPCIFVKRKRLLWGFASTTLALLIVSVWISGFGAITAYTRFLLQLNSLPMAGIHDAQKANLRGLFGLLLPGYQHTASYLSLLSSVLVMYLAVRSSLLAREDVRSARLAFANAVFAAVLVGYHLSPHDITILLLPMVLLVDYLLAAEGIPTRTRFALLLTLAALFLPPLHLFLLHWHRYTYACIPILVLFGMSCAEIRSKKPWWECRSSSRLPWT